MRRVILAAMLTSQIACAGETKFDPTYRAGQAVQAAVDDNVDRDRYETLVLAFNTEITIVYGKAMGAEETELVTLYTQALESYTVALLVWKLKVEGTDVVPRSPVLEKALEQYDVTFEDDKAPAEATMRKIWPIAKARLNKANARLNGR